MHISVVGCNHGIQLDPAGYLAQLEEGEEQNQRRHFAVLLERIVNQQNIQFIGEEGGSGEPTSAERLGQKYKVPVQNINTRKEDLDHLQIPRNYVEDAKYSNEQKQAWHSQREQFMLETIRKGRGDAKNLLVICGFEHLERLAKLLEADGAVQQINYRGEEWYRRIFQGDV